MTDIYQKGKKMDKICDTLLVNMVNTSIDNDNDQTIKDITKLTNDVMQVKESIHESVNDISEKLAAYHQSKDEGQKKKLEEEIYQAAENMVKAHGELQAPLQEFTDMLAQEGVASGPNITPVSIRQSMNKVAYDDMTRLVGKVLQTATKVCSHEHAEKMSKKQGLVKKKSLILSGDLHKRQEKPKPDKDPAPKAKSSRLQKNKSSRPKKTKSSRPKND